MDLGVDLLLDLENVVLRVQDADQLVELFADRRELQDALLHVHGLHDVRRDVEHAAERFARVLERDEHFAGDVPVEVDVLGEEARGVPEQRVQFGVQRHARGAWMTSSASRYFGFVRNRSTRA